MGVHAAVRELVETFKESYGAIDIRTAAVREGEAWVSVLTVVRLTYEEPELAVQRLRQLEQRQGRVEAKHFSVAMCARPFSEWQNLCGEVEREVLTVGSLETKLRQAVVLENQRNQIDALSTDIRPFDGATWPSLCLHVGPPKLPELIDEQLTREVSTRGYSDPYEAINALCEVNVRQGQSYGYDFYLSLPVFIRVSDARLAPAEKRLYVTVKRHNRLGDIRGNVLLRGARTTAGQPYKARLTIDSFSRSEEGSPIETASGFVELPETETEDWVDVKLAHSEFGEIDGCFLRQLRWLTPPAERNTLFEALKCFCPDAKLQESLVRAYGAKHIKLKTSAAFELHVAWLLGLLGCSTIILGEYEHLFAPESNVELGSVDILALTPEKTLLLVGCSLTEPEERDINTLRNVRRMLRQTALKDATCSILPVFFTAAAECSSYREHGLLDFTPIVNAHTMNALLTCLRTGREKDFLDFLADPQHSPLGDS